MGNRPFTNKKNITDEPYYLVMTLSENIQNLKKVQIHFENQQDEESGFYELMVSGMPAVALDNGRYLANALFHFLIKMSLPSTVTS